MGDKPSLTMTYRFSLLVGCPWRGSCRWSLESLESVHQSCLHVFSVTGGVQPVEPDWSVRGFDAYSPGGIVAHHLAAGLLYILLRMGNIALSATLLLVVQG